MEEELKEHVKDEELNKDDAFLNTLNSTLSVKRDYEKMQYDYEWLDKIEYALPYLDNILKNPKRFIVNEEEVVKVELARRVTVESVIHLTQHTNLIQDIDKDGDVKPSKILNINREESLDTYENRFVFTLINNMEFFFNERVAASGASSYYIDKKDSTYDGNAKVGTENIHISLSINSLDKDISENKNKYGESFEDRVKKVKLQIDGFHASELYRTLSKLHVAPVRSPIRKTNVILKNPNFRIAESLWNYIQSFQSKDKKEFDKKDYFDNGNMKEDFNHAVLLAYIASRSISEAGSNHTINKVATEMIERLIENILDTDITMDEDKLKKLFDSQIQQIKKRNKEKSKKIYNIFVDRIEKEKNNYKEKALIFKEI